MTTFLSEPVVSGFMIGVAVHATTSQLRHVVGVLPSAIRVDPGPFALQKVLVYVLSIHVCICMHVRTCYVYLNMDIMQTFVEKFTLLYFKKSLTRLKKTCLAHTPDSAAGMFYRFKNSGMMI